MTTPTFNKFKSTTIYGNFNNVDYPDNSVLASAYFQRNLTISGDLTCSGIIYGKKLFYDNVDISSTFVSNLTLSATLSNYTLSSSLSSYVMSGGSASFNMLNLNQPAFIQFLDNSGNTKALIYPSAISNVFRFSVLSGNGFEWEEAGTTLMQLNTSGHLTLSGATFSGNVSGLTAAPSDNSNTFATTAFVKAQNYATSNPDLSPYALLSGAFFTGNVSGLTAVSTDNSNKLATTAFVKSQGYINNGALSPYALLGGATFTGNVAGLTALSTDNSNKFATTAFVKAQNYLTSSALSALNDYALLSGAVFTGNVNGLTAVSTDNTTKFATTAFVKAQNYITSASLSPYALLSGATFTGTVNLNNGFATPTGKDVFIGCNNTFPTTNSGAKTGLGFYWNQSGGVGETNLVCFGQGGTGGLSIWNSNVSNVPNKLVEFYPSGSVFTTTVNGITPATSNNSTQFATTAWVKLQNYLTTGSLSYSTITVPTTNTLDNFQGNYWTQYSVRPTNSVTTLNGVTTVNIGLQVPYAGSPPSTTQIVISNTFYALGTVANPDTAQNDTFCLISPSYGATPTNTTNFFNINMYNATNGTLIRGYGTLLKSFSTNSYSIIFVATGGVVFTVNTPYTFDPFQFTYT